MAFTASGPRLTFNFGFTDLGAGRYLEAWIPCNLIFDQFELDLELEVTNTALAHTVITNGSSAALGVNHWSIHFPARFTALSPLLEVRATDTLASFSDTTTLPVSGVTVTIEAWKLASSGVDLNARVDDLKGWLAANETAVGPYLHGNRFVAFLIVGGMEYEGGTTAGPSSLKHETFHSWFARGLKPASQPDAWWDEGWTVYNDSGGTGSVPFDFTSPAVELRTANAWSRITPGASYMSGERFFQGAAAMLGAPPLHSLMGDLYRERSFRPLTTTELEAFLVCRSGRPELVDAFHRFIYGLPDPSPPPDLWMRDDPSHAGSDFWSGRFWDSSDLWVRNQDDGDTAHQAPEHGQDNWLYARVRNRSTTTRARHFLVTFNARSFAGTEFVYPSDFLPCIAAAAGFDLDAGGTTIVKARWPAALVPPAGTHACLLAAVITRLDHPLAGRHVWEHNNLAQKNLTIVDLLPGDWIVLPFVVGRLGSRRARPSVLELVRPKRWPTLPAEILHATGRAFGGRLRPPKLGEPRPSRGKDLQLDCGGVSKESLLLPAGMWTSKVQNTLIGASLANAAEFPFEPGRTSRIPIESHGTDQMHLGLRLHVPRDVEVGETLNLDIVERSLDDDRILGGLALRIHVNKHS